MDDADPINTFFPDQESVDLYEVLGLTIEATTDAIKKAYRKLALTCHPDKQAAASDEQKAKSATRFQQVGFAYAVLGDDKRRERYDKTGRTDEGFDLGAGDDGWEAYFEDLFDRVTRDKLDEMKKEYQGSEEELADLKAAYSESQGSIADIMNAIPHSTFDDEPRFIVAISKLVASRELPTMAAWEKEIKDEKAKLVRKKQGQKEAAEAEEMAKELGVWDEFYGSGKTTQRASRGKGKKTDDGDEDHSALQALILKKKAKSNDFFDSLAAKYAEPEPKARKGKKRASEDSVDDEPPPKKQRGAPPPPPEIDDAEFEKLQQKLFGDKDKASSTTASASKGKGKKGRKAK
ncbi:Galactose oxidase [Mycena indigotica]|uniref:Galactose oxidase n=1 Tax=Mycena indigotica TaxID=2126181 RepID=A0A8H6VWZ1_9AGAR|nr:Galactose oxidase [Mycena indigotica]KAF7294946.1 Galactose oxidase [Mycena indigotica]